MLQRWQFRSRQFALSGVLSYSGPRGMLRDRTDNGENPPCCMRNLRKPATFFCVETYVKKKKTGHRSKEWAALSGEGDVRSDTRQGPCRWRAIERGFLKARPRVSAGELDNVETMAVTGVSYVPALALPAAAWHTWKENDAFFLT